MYIVALDIDGFADLPHARLAGLERVVRLQPGPQATAVGDALDLLFSALDPLAASRFAWRLGLVGSSQDVEVEGHPLPTQLAWEDEEAALGLVADREHPQLLVEATLALDPPLFGFLRGHAARDPRLVTALGARPELRIKVGAAFTRSLDLLALNVHRVTIGEAEFVLNGNDMPTWMGELLRLCAGRFARGPLEERLPELALAAAESRTRYAGYQAWTRSFPPEWGPVRAAVGPDAESILLVDERPGRRWGARLRDRALTAALVHLCGADVALVESEDPWVEGCVEGDGSALEQVFRICSDGAPVGG